MVVRVTMFAIGVTTIFLRCMCINEHYLLTLSGAFSFCFFHVFPLLTYAPINLFCISMFL